MSQKQKKSEIQQSSDSRPMKSREFETYHAFYLHDHTNNPHNIIRSRANPVQIASNYRNLESGSDCDVGCMCNESEIGGVADRRWVD